MRRAAIQVGAAAIIVAVAGYVAQFVAARWLGPARYTEFAVFWALLFIIVGTLSGVAQEFIRVSRRDKLQRDAGQSLPEGAAYPRIAPVALAIGAIVAVLVLVTGSIWGASAFHAEWVVPVALLAGSAVLASGSGVFASTFAGQARWSTYALLVILEGVARIACFVIAGFLAPNVLGFSIAAALAFAPVNAVGFLTPRLRRESFSIRSDAPLVVTSTRIVRSMAASALSSILTVGWPALLSAAAHLNPRGSTAVSLGVLILLVTLTRAPLMVPLTSFQNALVARFTGLEPRERRRWVVKGMALIVAASVLLAVLAAVLGPVLLPLIFGASYRAEPALIGTLTAAAAGLGIITLTGVAAMTANRHSEYLLGWAVAILVALLLLFLAPIDFEWAAVLALLIGPIAGAVVQLTTLRRGAA